MGAAGRPVAHPGQAQDRLSAGRWSAATLPGVRCLACDKRIAEEADVRRGRVVIKCRRCHANNVFTEAGRTLA